MVNAGVPQSAEVLDSFVDVIGSQLRMSVLAANGAFAKREPLSLI